jgi:predicted nucleic acid-binding protein
VIVVDTSVIVAYMNAADDHHATVAGWLDGADDDLATTPLIIAEVDHRVGAPSSPGGSPRSRSRLSTSDTSASCDPWPAAGHFGSYRLICEPLALGRRSGTERISVPNPR